MGLSYAAHTQGALGCAGAPGVAAMFLDSGGFSNAYQGGIRQGGAFELKQVTWAYSNALVSPAVLREPARLAALKAIDIKQWFARMPDEQRLVPCDERGDQLDRSSEGSRRGSRAGSKGVRSVVRATPPAISSASASPVAGALRMPLTLCPVAT